MTGEPQQQNARYLKHIANISKTATILRWLVYLLVIAIIVRFASRYAPRPSPSYASTVIQISKDVPYFLIPHAEVDGEYEMFVSTQRSSVRSRLVLGRVIASPEIAKLHVITTQQRPLDWLAERIDLTQQGESELYSLSFRHDDAEVAVQIVDAITEVYFEFRDEHAAEESGQMIESLEGERTLHMNKVTRLRDSVRQLATEHGEPEIGKATFESLELEFKMAELERAKTMFSRIGARIEELVLEQRAPSRVQRRQEGVFHSSQG